MKNYNTEISSLPFHLLPNFFQREKKKIIPASHSSHIQAYLKGLIQTRKLEALTSLSFTDLAFVRKAVSGAALVVHMALLYLLELRLE